VRKEPIKVDFPASGPRVTRWIEVRSNSSLASTPPTETQTHRDSEQRPGSTASLSSLDALPPLLTIEEVAAVLRTSRKGVYAMAERKQLPGVTRIGRRLLVRRDDLLSWLDERRAASPGGTRR
jgi:excisionase family DNA binding protein